MSEKNSHATDLSQTQDQTVAYMVGRVMGCKWSYSMLDLIRRGVVRPGAIRQHLPGLTPKVQTECLHIMVGFGIVERTAFASKIPHVEYTLTEKGSEIGAILDAIQSLQGKWQEIAPTSEATG